MDLGAGLEPTSLGYEPRSLHVSLTQNVDVPFALRLAEHVLRVPHDRSHPSFTGLPKRTVGIFIYGGCTWSRTTDAGLFRPSLYLLSYTAIWQARCDSNTLPLVLETSALPGELRACVVAQMRLELMTSRV